MNGIINFVAKVTGAAKLWDAVNGYKTKIGAVSLILSGLAELTQKISALTDFASVIAFIKVLPMDAGWMALAAGIAALGIGHKMEKAEQPK
jgi:hypothetical protein